MGLRRQHSYCSQLSILILKHIEIVNAHARPDHSNTHGIRKGASLFATSGTTCPPPMSSVAKRGEWTLGQVFDIGLNACRTRLP
jgi:hypothetical protein